jgi:glycosyltransferase involved in cell wall biosynthesis
MNQDKRPQRASETDSAAEQNSALKQQVGQEQSTPQAGEKAQAQAQATTMLKAELEAARARLEEANQNYREATEQICALKQRVTQEEAMQQGAEQARAQAAAQLAEVQRSFQEERKTFQQQLAQSIAEGQAKTATMYEGEKKLIRLESELEARSRLEEANQKYRGATEQVTTLKQRVTEEEVARKTVEQALQAAEKKLTGLSSELAAARTRLEEANQKYRGATEQVTTLKQRVTQEETAHQAAEQALAQATRELEQSDVRLQEERSALKQQIAQLSTQGQAGVTAAHEAEKRLIRLEAEKEMLHVRLEEARDKCQVATQQIESLTQRVREERAANLEKRNEVIRLTAQVERSREQLRTEEKAREIERADLRRQIEEHVGLTQQAKEALIQAEASNNSLKAQLAAAADENRQVAERDVRTKYQLKKEQSAGVGKLDEANLLRPQLATNKTETTRLQQDIADLQRRRLEVLQRNEELKEKLVALRREREADEVMARQIFHFYEELSSKERHAAIAAKLAEEKSLRVQQHLSYQVGKSIITSLKSPRKWFTMPLDIWNTYRQFQRSKSTRPNPCATGIERIHFDLAKRRAVLSLTSQNQSGSVSLAAGPLELWIKPYSLVASASIEIEWGVSCPNIDPLGGRASLKVGCISRLTVLPSGAGSEATISIKKLAGKPCVLEMNLRSGENTAAPNEGTNTDNQLPDLRTVEYKNVPYMKRQKPLSCALDQIFDGKPLISVIMTTYNTIDFLDTAIKSILNQSWRNLELIIVDDCSTDGTRERAEQYAQTDRRVRVFCFGENRGTYWCKNYGITLAAGVAITFMDSDDISHESRLEEQFIELNKKGRVMVTCNMVRKDIAGKLIAINGAAERIGPISKMIKRRVIDEVGYFDTIRTSADDEFMQRLKLVYGKPALFNVPKVLYTALVREQSLTTDPENAINLSASREGKACLSPQRAHYSGSYVGWHKDLASKGLVPYMPFPVVNRPFPVYGRLQVKENRYDGNAISVCLASFPSRKEQLRKTVLSILDRVDAIYVYLNEYLEVPDFLDHPHVHAMLGVNSKGDLRDNGKFYFFDQIPKGYCFTVDDDIDYPSDYFEVLIRKIEFYDRKAIIGVHGTIFAKPIESYFKDRKLYHFRDALGRDTVVNQLGTGTVGFHTDLWRPSLAWFKKTGMADLFVSIEAKRRNITLIAIERPPGWLKPHDMSAGESRNLFEEFKSNDVVQTKLIKAWEPFDQIVTGELASYMAQLASLGDSFLSKAVAIERAANVDLSGESLPDRSRAA